MMDLKFIYRDLVVITTRHRLFTEEHMLLLYLCLVLKHILDILFDYLKIKKHLNF